MSKVTGRISPGKYVMGVVLALVLAGLLIAVAACEDATPATSTSVAAVAETPTTEAAPVTTEQTTATTATEATAVTEATAASEGTVVNLGNSDNGDEVVLHVGDRLRIDLAPKAIDRVQSVKWDFEPIVVQEKDSGEDKADDAVVGAWLEVEAVVAGPVTIRAEYEYPGGTVTTPWIIFVTVTD